MLSTYFENNLAEEHDVEVSHNGENVVTLALVGDYSESVILEPWAARAIGRALTNMAELAEHAPLVVE
jgi:hypothetical protein